MIKIGDLYLNGFNHAVYEIVKIENLQANMKALFSLNHKIHYFDPAYELLEDIPLIYLNRSRGEWAKVSIEEIRKNAEHVLKLIDPNLGLLNFK